MNTSTKDNVHHSMAHAAAKAAKAAEQFIDSVNSLPKKRPRRGPKNHNRKRTRSRKYFFQLANKEILTASEVDEKKLWHKVVRVNGDMHPALYVRKKTKKIGVDVRY